MRRLGPKLGISVLLLGGCGHAAAESASATTDLAAQQNRSARMEGDLLRYEARITELEARMALLEQEARGERPTARLGETVRIGASVRSERAQVEVSPMADDDGYLATQGGERVPMLKLYGEPRREPASQVELGPLPAPPPGVSMQLPVVALPGKQPIPNDDGAAREAYRVALEQLRGKHYAEAQAALNQFMARYAAHELAGSAAYWLGEAHYAQRDYGRALEAFELVVKRYPQGNKVPDALLKLAMCHRRLGDAERADGYLKRVRQEFPNSPAAHLATREGSS
jgi:tol-pal system protein YbgF